jgi:uncharacterized protein (DUF849 family)
MIHAAYSEMTVPAGPAWVEEHLRRLQANGIQPHFQLTGMHALETLERMVRKGHYTGPLNLTWIGIGGGFRRPEPVQLHGLHPPRARWRTVTSESLLKNVLPFNTMSMALGMHPRCGNEDTILIGQQGRAHDGSVAADRTACASPANWARDRQRQRSARDLQHRRPVPGRRRKP